MASERDQKTEQSNQDRETLLEKCRDGLSELRNLKYPGFIFISWHEGKSYSFEKGQTYTEDKDQGKSPITPGEITLENFPDYAQNSPLLPALASIINDARSKTNKIS